MTTHAAFEVLGYAAGGVLCLHERRRLGDSLALEHRLWILAAAMVGGLAGSRLLYLVEDPVALVRAWREPAFLLGGKSIVGALVGGTVAVEAAKRRLGVTVSTGDILAVPLTLGIAIGRIGCFSAGLADDTYGTPTSVPWAVDFGDGVPRHPTQLYEIAFLLGLAGLLVTRGNRLATPGDRFKLFMVAYLAFRLLVDFIKPAVRFAELSAIQWTCVVALACYAPHLRRLLSEVRHE